jgi:SAM-dependent methyltransferase
MRAAIHRARRWGTGRLARIGLWAAFLRDFLAFRRLAASPQARFAVSWSDRYPCLHDKTASTGFDRHYIYHTAWAARVVRETTPALHVDISSSLYFSAIVSAFCPVKFYDYRPADLGLAGLENGPADLLDLPFADRSIASLSCMHVVEHVGLGRYGDPLDPDGDLKAIAELRRVLAPGGNLLFVVPIGKPRVMFNAHRIYSYDQIREYFRDLRLHQFALVPDDARDGGLVYDASRALADAQSYGCGCFWFRKEGRQGQRDA